MISGYEGARQGRPSDRLATRSASYAHSRIPGEEGTLALSVRLIAEPTQSAGGIRRVARRIAILAGLLTTLGFGAACQDGDGGRPGSTPAPGQPQSTERDVIYPASSASGDQLLFNLTCTESMLTLVTTVRIVYAALPCDRLLPADVVKRFLGQSVEIVIRGDPATKLLFTSKTAGSVEFTVSDVQVEDTAAP